MEVDPQIAYFSYILREDNILPYGDRIYIACRGGYQPPVSVALPICKFDLPDKPQFIAFNYINYTLKTGKMYIPEPFFTFF